MRGNLPLPRCAMSMVDKLVSEYLAAIGSKGGRAGGGRKVRGDKEYYQRISRLAAEARKRKRTL